MYYKRFLVVFLMVVVCGWALAAPCGNCDKEVSRDVEFCHWCGKAIDNSDNASNTKATFGSRTFRACGKIWKAIDDADISFDDAQRKRS